MLDPGTILAITGLTLQCFDLLLKSISKTEKTTRTWRTRREKLREWSRRLEFCNMQIQGWFDTWGGFDEGQYRLFWGEKTFNNIQSWLADVRFLVDDIAKTVKVGERPPPSSNFGSIAVLDWQIWRDMDIKTYKRITKNAATAEERKGFLEKLTFALYSDEKLRDSFERLERSLKQLDDVARVRYRLLRKESGAQTVEREELERTYKAESRLSSVAALAGLLFEAQRTTTGDRQWALELRKPDEYGDARRIDLMAELYLDFSIQTFDQSVWRVGERFRIPIKSCTTEDIDDMVKSVMIELADPVSRNQPSTSQSPRIDRRTSPLPEPSQLSLPLRSLTSEGIFVNDRTLQAWSSDQACLIHGFVHWTLLLWNTEWTQKLCCCCIRFQSISGHGRQYILSSAQHIQCRSFHSSSRKLVTFGITVAEIITTVPLRVSWDNPGGTTSTSTTKNSYTLEYWDIHAKRWREISYEEIVQRVWHRSRSEKVAEAVSHCLDSKLLIEESSPGFLNFYTQHILFPIDEHCKIVLEHRKRFEHTAWWKIFVDAIFGCDWPPLTVLEQEPSRVTSRTIPGAFVQGDNGQS